MPLDYILEKPDYVLEEPWEKEEKEKANKLNEMILKERIEFMEKCYIEGFSELTQKILFYATYKGDVKESKNALEELREKYQTTLENAYGKDFQKELEDKEYMKEILDIYREISELEKALKKEEFEDFKKWSNENIWPAIEKISDLSRRWAFRLNLYRNLIGKGSKNYEVKDLEDPTYDEELRKY